MLTTLAGQKKGAIGQHDTSARWLSEAVHAFKAVCYMFLNCHVNSDGSVTFSLPWPFHTRLELESSKRNSVTRISCARKLPRVA